MKNRLEDLLYAALDTLRREGALDPGEVMVQLERTRDPLHGDFASNLALALAKAARCNPRQLAERIAAALPADPAVRKVEIAGPGFINFFLDPLAQYAVIPRIHDEGARFGHSTVGAGKRVQVEFVSANPTGPLHVGHGRGAAYGSTVANLLAALGFEVHREYYVNDAGRQMDILAASVWLRYLEECGEHFVFPANGYRGAYIRTIAQQLRQDAAMELFHPAAAVFDGLPPDEPQGGDKELYIDAVVARAKELLGPEGYSLAFEAGLISILDDIRDDLAEFGVHYDEWFPERSLTDYGAVEACLDRLRAAGWLYEDNGATWFASSRLGDEKDRVVIRENGQITYFASDIAYHWNKIERGFERILNIWGADHHGYIPRVKAALTALNTDAERLQVLLVQFAVLWRGEEKVQMSTRSGEFITLRQLRNEVGRDATRFFYLMRKSDQHLDFDLQLATSRSNENPVYYVQYAHARVCSVFRQLDEKGWARDMAWGMNCLPRLSLEQEISLTGTLARYPEVLERAGLHHEPHQLVHYLRELAQEFHAYYNTTHFLVEDADVRDARLNLIDAVRQVLSSGLGLLGVSAPESM